MNVPVFILSGGLGTRLSEETQLKPKPMVEIGDIPILVHLMRFYYSYGFNDFVICAGYRSWEIKNYFLNYKFRLNHLEIDHRQAAVGDADIYSASSEQEKWRVRVIDTGSESCTGARIARAFDLTHPQEKFSDFAVTYGDGLCDVDLQAEWAFHQKHKLIGTVLGVPPVARFGELEVDKDQTVRSFLEKPQSKLGLINGGFFFFKNQFREYLSSEIHCTLEREPLVNLTAKGQLKVFPHSGFWHPMDTLRDKNFLQEVWDSKQAPWKRG